MFGLCLSHYAHHIDTHLTHIEHPSQHRSTFNIESRPAVHSPASKAQHTCLPMTHPFGLHARSFTAKNSGAMQPGAQSAARVAMAGR